MRWLPEQKAAGTWQQKAQELFQVCSASQCRVQAPGDVGLHQPLQYMHQQSEMLLQMFVNGVLKAPHGKVFPLEQAADAVEESMRHGKGDKVLLKG